jgi:sirohydrochlorin ferrochelatase
VDEIVCHPYFLSPGRHVVQDIPTIVAAAVDALDITVPVRTTAPLGSVTDVMMGAIHALVQETSEFYPVTEP